jgi:nucleoside-diphosphate-sugar epimerase
METKNILVTGAGSGLGNYLCNRFQCQGFLRNTSIDQMMDNAAQRPFKAIIHSAFNPRQDINSANLQSYLNDTILLTKKILQIPHEYFIFISSGDVYPKNDEIHYEDEEIQIKDVDSIYGVTKLMSESLVQEDAKNFLILRPTVLLGQNIRKNSLIRILTEAGANLTLSEQSTFNYVLHSDIGELIEKALSQHLRGIYNIAASTNISLGEIAETFKRPIRFGNYTYRTGNINNEKSVSVSSNFRNTSLDNIKLFKQNYLT